jgi:hypothetical protein
MLIKRAQLDAIVRGDVGLAFRRWKRATVKAGGTLQTAVGVLAIDAVERVSMASITKADARRAGYADRASLLSELKSRTGSVYRIALRYSGADPRIALRKRSRLTSAERAELQQRLARHDQRSSAGPWTGRVLQCLSDQPGVRAADLALQLGYEKVWFKSHVRKLKTLGLTESLEVGYRLSARGRALLADA